MIERARAASICVGLSLVLAVPGQAWAGPPGEGETPTVDAAMESGDLSTALERARMDREADPAGVGWRTEGEVRAAMADYQGAIEAYRAYLETEGREDAAEIEGRIETLEEASRGRVADEPESTHRETLDQDRADRIAALNPEPEPEPAPPPEPVDERKPIVKQWYFWVTLGAIAASATAITVIAVRSASNDDGDALSREVPPGSFRTGARNPLVWRF